MHSDAVARRLDIEGIVQGVGFRPFVYQQARQFGLMGDVSNTAAGVVVHVEGRSADIEAFCRTIVNRPPPLAQITGMHVKPAAFKNCNAFTIVASKTASERSTLISPDSTVCEDCLRELFDRNDRRYRYPFINCTNCGPRYTIIDDIPYDRPNTCMRHFKMCARCQSEYDDPGDRRFHAQPNACPVCGPQVCLSDCRGAPVAADDAIEKAAQLLAQGKILAVKGLGGYHLAADAANAEAVARLRRRKLRAEKPLALMCRDLTLISQIAHVGDDELALLQSRQRPIVLLPRKPDAAIAENVAPGNRYLGVMLPYTPLHHLLLAQRPRILVMTSGNLSDEPIAIDNQDAFARLSEIADYFLTHDREIYLRSDDSVVRHVAADLHFLRRSRGYVPQPVFLAQDQMPVLALGAELKNTICLTKANRAFVSQHIGDLENLATFGFFKLTIAHLRRILEIDPVIVAHDLHPDYLSTQYAKELNDVETVAVQHHHAHIVSCMAEHHLTGPVIGLAFDGTGYGADGHIWGGEILLAELHRYRRMGHLAYIRMPGAAAAIRSPWRMALSYLYAAYGRQMADLDLPLLARSGRRNVNLICRMIDRQFNSPLTSSVGRLFDAVAALCDLGDTVTFEGQAAMALEMAAAESDAGSYDCSWTSVRGIYQLNAVEIIRAVAKDLAGGTPAAVISARFHQTLIQLFADVAHKASRSYGIDTVVLSGGVFQNARLLDGLLARLQGLNLKAYAHRQVPANDGGICLGQAVAAAEMVARRQSGESSDETQR